jgi:hypothetical protein
MSQFGLAQLVILSVSISRLEIIIIYFKTIITHFCGILSARALEIY